MIRSLTSIGLVVLVSMSASYGLAEDAPKLAATAAAKTESPAVKPAKTLQPAKPQDGASNMAKTTQSAKPKTKLNNILSVSECVRTGQRIIAALARDDSGAASQFHTFYMAFKCSPAHLAQAFGCLVNLQTANPELSNPSTEQVTQCWDEPTVMPKVHQQPTTDGASEKH